MFRSDMINSPINDKSKILAIQFQLNIYVLFKMYIYIYFITRLKFNK